VSPFVLSVLKYALLALLYFFVYRAVRSMSHELSGRRPAPGEDRSAKAPKPAARPPRPGRLPTSVVVHAPEARKPRAFKLSGVLEIGRAESCQVRLDDTYASQHHAKLSKHDGAWVVEDLGSTNGTFVNDHRVQAPTEVRAGDVMRIGNTVLELRR
jgi:FHA domain